MFSPIMPVYNPAPVSPVKGEGLWLIEADGTRWLDAIGGVATNALGHCHPVLVQALNEQSSKLWHTSNALRIPGQIELAERLTAATFADRVFFSSTGTEAVECAIKTARRYHKANGQPDRFEVIGFHGSFHGRTYGAINAAGNPAYLDGFGPTMPGFIHLSMDDHVALAEAVARPGMAAVIVEPVQGEGGARAFSGEDLRRLRDLCTRHGVLLIHDEVQSGMGRTGRLFAHQWFDGCAPDIMAIAKALGSGFPVGACLATGEAAKGMTVSTHGTTMGGNPLGMAVALAAFEVIADEATLANARSVSDHLRAGLQSVAERNSDIIVEIRGKGMLVGVKLAPNNREFLAKGWDQKILLSGCGDNCVRILPPLTLTVEESDEIVRRMEATCTAMRVQLAAVA